MFKQTLNKGIACLVTLGLLGSMGWAQDEPAKKKGIWQIAQSMSFEEIYDLHLLIDKEDEGSLTDKEKKKLERLTKKWRSLDDREKDEVFRKLDLLDWGVDPSIVKDDAKLYKTTLSPKKSIPGIPGIKTGTVIAYGHLLKPPYYVERKDEEVFINGIQVSPKLSNPNYKIKPKVFTEEERKRYKEETEIEGKTGKALKEYYLEVKAKEGKDIAWKKLKEFAKKFPIIEKIEMEYYENGTQTVLDDLVLFVTWKGEKYPEGIMNFNHYARRPTEEELRKDRLEYAISQKGYFENSLKDNNTLIFSYRVEIGMGSGIKESIRNIMENFLLSKKEKIKRLEVLVNDDDPAKEIFYNYKSKDWKE